MGLGDSDSSNLLVLSSLRALESYWIRRNWLVIKEGRLNKGTQSMFLPNQEVANTCIYNPQVITQPHSPTVLQGSLYCNLHECLRKGNGLGEYTGSLGLSGSYSSDTEWSSNTRVLKTSSQLVVLL